MKCLREKCIGRNSYRGYGFGIGLSMVVANLSLANTGILAPIIVPVGELSYI